MGFKQKMAVAGVSGLAIGGGMSVGIYEFSEYPEGSTQAAECADDWTGGIFSEACAALVRESIPFKDKGEYRVDTETGELFSVNSPEMVSEWLDYYATDLQGERRNDALLIGTMIGTIASAGTLAVLVARDQNRPPVQTGVSA